MFNKYIIDKVNYLGRTTKMLCKKYGIVTISKGSKLYIHNDTNDFMESWRYFLDSKKHLEEYKNKNVPIIHLSFHPSEFELYQEYIVKVKLNRDIKLLFLLDDKIKINNSKYILSTIDDIIECKKNYHQRILDESLKDISNLLNINGYDGYLSMKTHGIKRNVFLNIGLINDKSIYTICKTSKLKRFWRETYILPNYTRIKQWDNKYKICSINKPIKFYLNIRYKNLIEKYMEEKNEKIPDKYLIKNYTFEIYTFDIILRNAIIEYYCV